MAKITITIEDGIESSTPVATAMFDLDMQGATEGTPTTAVLFGATIQRLWRSRALAPLVPLICGDMMHGARRAVEQVAPTVQ
jgi:hypothetical protein